MYVCIQSPFVQHWISHQQAAGCKLQAASCKLQAFSMDQLATRPSPVPSVSAGPHSHSTRNRHPTCPHHHDRDPDPPLTSTTRFERRLSIGQATLRQAGHEWQAHTYRARIPLVPLRWNCMEWRCVP
jgi:hypothetical protein